MLRSAKPDRFLAAIVILALITQRLIGDELPRGKITLSGVRGKVEVTSGDRTHRARNGTQLVEGVTIHFGTGARAVMLMDNGAALLIIGEARVDVESFEVFPFQPPRESLYEIRREPSYSRTVLSVPFGEFFCEVKVLDPRSSFLVKAPFGWVHRLPNDTNSKTSFYMRSRKGEEPLMATWHGRIEIEVPDQAPRLVEGDSHIFFKSDNSPMVAHGLEWSYVKMLEKHMYEVHKRQKKFRFR